MVSGGDRIIGDSVVQLDRQLFCLVRVTGK